MQLEGKRIILTGGARGMGASLVNYLVREGAAVASLDVRDDVGEAVARVASDAGPGRARFWHCDISRRAEVEAVFAQATEWLGGLDGLIACAAVEEHAVAEELTDEQWDRLMSINVNGTFITNQVAFRYLKDRGGRILNFGSDAGLVPYPSAIHYSASKGAVMAITRSLSRAWGQYGITVNSLVPAIWTAMYDEHRSAMSNSELAAHDAALAQSIPIGGKLGDPDRDFAPVVGFLLGEGSRFITGQIISVNGGGNCLH